MTQRYGMTLSLILLIKAVIIIWVVQYAGIGLGPDEAQYWTWSQLLDWGYYSKPPGIAWQIGLGCQAFGNTELGVRFLSIVLGFITAWLVYRLARTCLCAPSTAFWAAMIMALCPLGIMGSFLAITDVGMIAFWILACTLMASAIQRKTSPNFYLLGVFILFGALFKWPIYLFWIFVLCYPRLYNKHLVAGVTISLLGLLPSVIWNATNEWATFRHVLSTIAGGHANDIGTTPLPKGNFWDFVGAQAALLSPILFILLVLGYISLLRNRRTIPSGVRFCGLVSLTLLTAYSGLAIFKKMQGNWCVFAYPAGIVFLSWYACEKIQAKKWLIAGVSLSVVLCTFVFSIPYVQAHSILSGIPIPYKTNPFRHNLGWDRLRYELEQVGYDPSKHFLFGDKYQMTSILSFYGPKQKRAYFLNLHGARKNQFSFWPSMADEQIGETGFFVLAENRENLEESVSEYQDLLSEYFDEVRFLGVRPLFYSYGKPVKHALIFECIDYQGQEPKASQLY